MFRRLRQGRSCTLALCIAVVLFPAVFAGRQAGSRGSKNARCCMMASYKCYRCIEELDDMADAFLINLVSC